MKAIHFLEYIKQSPTSVLTIKEAAKIIKKPLPNTRLYLYRLKSKGYIQEIEPGKYTLSIDSI